MEVIILGEYFINIGSSVPGRLSLVLIFYVFARHINVLFMAEYPVYIIGGLLCAVSVNYNHHHNSHFEYLMTPCQVLSLAL